MREGITDRGDEVGRRSRGEDGEKIVDGGVSVPRQVLHSRTLHEACPVSMTSLPASIRLFPLLGHL